MHSTLKGCAMSQVNLEKTELKNERLEFGSGTVYFLGPHLTLRGCTLVLDMAARDLIIPQAYFIDCTFILKREFKSFLWEHATLKGCRFTGRLSGNDFGRWPYSERFPGSIEDCDFTEARLHECRFISCDLNTLRLPTWPCFTLLEPPRRSHELLSVTWPGMMDIAIKVAIESPDSTAAITFWAPAAAKWAKTTVEEIRAVLERLDGVRY
jgi:hypothetical protein